jgi:hypothetical protein
MSDAQAQQVQAPLMSLGSVTVTSVNGSAAYQIPLEVPPGAAGVQPVLALRYLSESAGVTYLGAGWSLLGDPFLRCANAPEKFCIGGDQAIAAPLVAAKGKYGADGTEYRTENDKFERFVSHGGRDGQPDWFERTSKSGDQITEYGNAPNAQERDSANGRVQAWLVTSGRNSVGDTVSYSYDRDGATGQVYPTRIDYTGNSGTKLSPYDSVRFSYDTLDGVKKLTHIKTYAGDKLVRDYRLEYAKTPDSDQALLSKISLCDSGGNCLMPTSLKWNIVHPKDSKRALPLISEAENGLGYVHWFSYRAPPALPAKASAALKAAYPTQIVSTIGYTDATGGQSHDNYEFSGAPLLMPDGSFGGFTRWQVTDQEQGEVRTTTRSADPNMLGATLSSTVSIGPVETSSVTNTYGHRPTVKGAGFYFLTQSITRSKDLEGHALLTETSRQTVDDFGNATSIVQSREDGWSKTTEQKFTNDTAHWHIGTMVHSQTVFKNANGEVRRDASFQYDPNSGLPTQDVIEPDVPQYRLQTDYAYDDLGHRIRETVSGADIQTRTATATYDDRGLFDIRQKVGHDPATGQPLGTADGGTITRDGFGRITAQDSPKEKLTVRYAYCKSVQSSGEDCPPLAATLMEARYSAPATVRVTSYFSGGGFFMGSLSAGTGRPLLQERSYDRRQHMIRNCAQMPGNEKPACESFRYDVTGRLVSATDSMGHESSYAYDGLTTKVTDASGVTTTTVHDSDGKIVKLAKGDASNSYVRGPLGLELEAHASDGRWLKKSYDVRGNLVKYTSGTGDKQDVSVERRLNALNELVSMTDADGKTQTFQPEPVRIAPLSPNTEYVPPQTAKP